MNRSKSSGFTLIEIAVVLVIIGLLLGGVMKGKTLIENAKVSSEASRIDRINVGINLFFDRYQRYPGDGCNDNICSNNGVGTKDGNIFGGNENEAGWYELIEKTGILTKKDRTSVFGQNWNFFNIGNDTWLDLPGGDQADASWFCQLDKNRDDGNWNTGQIRHFSGGNRYDFNTDCWSLTGKINAVIQLDF